MCIRSLVFPLVASKECGAECTHQATDIGAHRFFAGNQLKGAQHRIVVKGAALHNHFFADSSCISQFDNFKEGVFNHRIRKPCRNVADGGSFFLCLFNAAIHKDRTAAAEIDRFGGEESSCGKIFNRHTERAGKVI